MEQTLAIAVLWVGLALVATFLGSRLKVSNALMEIAISIAATLAVPLPDDHRWLAWRSPSRVCLPIYRVRPAKNLPRRVAQIARSQAHV